MPDYQFWTLVGMLAAGFGWLIHKMDAIGSRVSKLEGETEVIKSMLQTVLTFLLGHKTGTDK